MEKRLFFGLQVQAPWPEELPSGRIIDEACRHMTLAFLGKVDFAKMEKALPSFPSFPLAVGPVGMFDCVLLLPERHPHVVAWRVKWLDGFPLQCAEQLLLNWFKENDFVVDIERGEPLPHVTLCRSPFVAKAWQRAFRPLPLMASALNLYESLGHSKYEVCWSYPAFVLPFEEIEHTADLAFFIRGENLAHLYCHAYFALAFKFPPLMQAWENSALSFHSLEEIVMALNGAIAKIDAEISCPFKAVTFHGSFLEERKGLLKWEMIVDV